MYRHGKTIHEKATPKYVKNVFGWTRDYKAVSIKYGGWLDWYFVVLTGLQGKTLRQLLT